MEEVKEEVKKFNMRSVKGGGGSEKVKLKVALCFSMEMVLEKRREEIG